MKYGNLILEKKEYVFLKRLLNVTGYYKDENTKVSLKKLSGELTSAIIYDHEEMPADVIRFNSVVKVDSKGFTSLSDEQLLLEDIPVLDDTFGHNYIT